jgi:hypothetical protein
VDKVQVPNAFARLASKSPRRFGSPQEDIVGHDEHGSPCEDSVGADQDGSPCEDSVGTDEHGSPCEDPVGADERHLQSAAGATSLFIDTGAGGYQQLAGSIKSYTF